MYINNKIMIRKTIMIDIDATLCKAPRGDDGVYKYDIAVPITETIEKTREIYNQGHQIILFTARGMKTFDGNVNEIEKFHRPILKKWLKENNVPYHDLIFGKPFYLNYYLVDDRNLSINQYINNNIDDYDNILKQNTID